MFEKWLSKVAEIFLMIINSKLKLYLDIKSSTSIFEACTDNISYSTLYHTSLATHALHVSALPPPAPPALL